MATELMKPAAALVVLALAWTPGVAEAQSASEELLREAHMHESRHEDDLALRRYAEALALDPTLGDAYLGLGALRLRLGEAREAERVYDTALSRVRDLVQARLGRARARHALGEHEDADADLESYVATTDDVEPLRELAKWYADEGRVLAELSAWRRLLARAEEAHDAAVRKEARLTVHALELIVAPADAVRQPPGEHVSAVRRGMARMEERR
jgi:tetratricopeptide (TPR) repeat protein